MKTLFAVPYPGCFDRRAVEALSGAAYRACAHGASSVELLHLLLSVIRLGSGAIEVPLRNMGCDVAKLDKHIVRYIGNQGDLISMRYVAHIEVFRAICNAVHFASHWEADKVELTHLFLGLLAVPNKERDDILREFGLETCHLMTRLVTEDVMSAVKEFSRNSGDEMIFSIEEMRNFVYGVSPLRSLHSWVCRVTRLPMGHRKRDFEIRMTAGEDGRRRVECDSPRLADS